MSNIKVEKLYQIFINQGITMQELKETQNLSKKTLPILKANIKEQDKKIKQLQKDIKETQDIITKIESNQNFYKDFTMNQTNNQSHNKNAATTQSGDINFN